MISFGKVLLAFLLATSATAQYWVGVRAGMINCAEGVFYIDKEQLQFPEARFREIPQGKSLRTENGWVEVQLGPNAFLWLGENGALRMENPSLTNIELLLERGSIVFEVSQQDKGSKFKIRFGEAVIEPKQPGLYRLDGGISQLSVYSGKAEIRLEGKKSKIKRGKAALIAGDMKAFKFDVQKMDRLQDVAVSRSQVLSQVLLEASIREGRAQSSNPGRWYEARDQQIDEQLKRLERESLYTQQQQLMQQQQTLPTGYPGRQEGHDQMPPGLKEAIDKASGEAAAGS